MQTKKQCVDVLLTSASVFVLAAGLFAAVPAMAQVAAPEAGQAVEDSTVEEVVVTGTRIRNGFQAPTPVTVASADQLKTAAPNNIADALNQLPAFQGSIRTVVGTNTNVTGATGQNLLNLRGLGANRSLILLNGLRMPATNATGSVDVNVMPQDLIQRVDIVTGGASAAYGSDAVTGVVNFVLDTKFEGLKAEVKGGISSRNDLGLGGASVSYGKSFAGGRGHFIGGLSYFYQEGVGVDENTHRKFYDDQAARIANPNRAAGQPANIIISSARSSLGTFGGLIVSGPLKGTQFLTGGVAAPFNYGSVTGSAFQSGGDGAKSYFALAPDQLRYSAFNHVEYEVSDKFTVFGEGLYSRSHTTEKANYLQNVGPALQYTIFRDNAYLPASIAQRMDAAGVTSFAMGRFEGDLPISVLESKIDVYRGVIGFRGDLNRTWRYDGSYSYGQSDLELRQNNLTKNRALYAAADAVRDPISGAIVCRSTLAGLDPGCVPRNLFGPQAENQAVNDYMIGDSVSWLTLKEQVLSLNIAGDLGEHFQLAGPISVAAGLEYRRESGDQNVDALSRSTTVLTGIRGFPSPANNKLGGWRTFNPQPFSGEYNIKEGYVEVGVPVLKDVFLAKALDLNGAFRHADYSQSGGVNTWKIGGVWQVVEALRFRSTYSQDIRGPNLVELFNPGSGTLNNLVYKGVSTQSQNITSGNAALTPERARTLTIGAVMSLPAIPGFEASIDYYRINIKDAISTLGPQRILDECAKGNTAICSQFSVTSAGTLIVLDQFLNLSEIRTAGIDAEAAYRTQIADGDFSVRLILNRGLKQDSQSLGSTPRQALGSISSPKWSGVLQLRYAKGPWSGFVQERYMGKAKLDPNYVDGVDISAGDNSAPPIGYTDVTVTYDLQQGKSQLYLSIANLLDQDPPLSPPAVTSFSFAASTSYDQVGRYFTAGARFKF